MNLRKNLPILSPRRHSTGTPAPGQVWPRDDSRNDGTLHGHMVGPLKPSGPLVVLEAGLGCPAAAWAWVQQGLSSQGIASLALDRPGIGWSSPSPSGAPTVEEHLQNLESVLINLGHHGPLWLIGHSVGGLLIRSIAERYARRTYGLTFVDSTHPEQLRSASQREAVLRHKHALQLMLRQSRWHKNAEHLVLDESPLGRLPEPVGQQVLKISRSRKHINASLAELKRWPEWAAAATSLKQLEAPVHVISAEKTLAPDPVQARLHQELTALSRTAHHHIVENSDHQSLIMDPSHAVAITQTVTFPTESLRPSVSPAPHTAASAL